jgi:fumarate hydratase class II
VTLLADGVRSFDRHCVAGIQPVRERIEANLRRSLMLVTALNPHIGYEQAAAIARKAHTDNLSLREAAVTLGILSGEQFDRLVRPEAMVGPTPPDAP